MLTLDEAINICDSYKDGTQAKQFSIWLRKVKCIDELVAAFCKFDRCFISMCEVCPHKECSSPNLFAMDLANKMYEYAKIERPDITKEEFCAFLERGISDCKGK